MVPILGFGKRTKKNRYQVERAEAENYWKQRLNKSHWFLVSLGSVVSHCEAKYMQKCCANFCMWNVVHVHAQIFLLLFYVWQRITMASSTQNELHSQKSWTETNKKETYTHVHLNIFCNIGAMFVHICMFDVRYSWILCSMQNLYVASVRCRSSNLWTFLFDFGNRLVRFIKNISQLLVNIV